MIKINELRERLNLLQSSIEFTEPEEEAIEIGRQCGVIRAQIRQAERVRRLSLGARPPTRQEAIQKGSVMYLGSTCKKGHHALRYTTNGHCVRCARAARPNKPDLQTTSASTP